MSIQANNPQAELTTALPIHVQDLTKKYGDMYALDSVSLDVKSGEFLTLLGPSGSGKTTLLMAIAGFNRPDSGSIRFGDEEVILKPPHKRNVGMVFQSYALFPHMSVAENIAFPLKLRGVGAAEAAERVDAALKTVQLDGLGNRGIEQLSGGQKQRVALARAFVFRPRILLMDEPTNHLDMDMRHALTMALQSFKGAILLISHDRHLLSSSVDTFYLVDNKTVDVFDGDLDDYKDYILKPNIVKIDNKKIKVKDTTKIDTTSTIKNLKSSISSLEKRISRLNGKLDETNLRLAEPDIYDVDRRDDMQDLVRNQSELSDELEVAEKEWMEKVTEMDAIK